MSQERMHPDDARRELASLIFLEWTNIPREEAVRCSVETADLLLAELARTAKPEDEPEFLAWRQKAWDNASRAEKAEARAKELEEAIKKHRSIVKGSQHWRGCDWDEDLWSRVK